MRVTLLVLIVLVLALAGAIAYKTLIGATECDSGARGPQPAWADRVTPVVHLAPGPLPKGSVLVGAEKEDTDGYPRQHVDQRALRSLLWHGRHDELNRYMEELQAAFEKDWRRELWPMDAGDAFASAEPAMRTRLDRWVTTTPGSFAPYLSRAAYWVTVGYARRGGALGADTSSSEFRGMTHAFRSAVEDLQRALAIRPRLVAAHRLVIQVALASSGDDLASRAIQGALEACPACFHVRVTYLVSLKPRWGGSHARMMTFAKSAPVKDNPRLRLLPGYVFEDQADTFLRQKKPHEALVMIERACSLGEHFSFLKARGGIKMRLDDHEGALADLDGALRLRPGHPEALFLRASIHRHLKQYAESGVDFHAAIQLRPTAQRARHGLEPTVQGLVYAAWQQHQTGQRRMALDLLDLALALAPHHRDALRRRSSIIEGGRGASDADLAQLQAEAREAPDDFRLAQQLDYVLARRRRYSEVIALWEAYLKRHPDHARALLERSGAYYHLQHLDKAIADAQRACALGLSEGCHHAARLERQILR